MLIFKGRLVSHAGGHASDVAVHVDSEWARIFDDHNKRHGAWRLDDLHVERVTVFRFTMMLDGVTHTFTPDDPNAFAEAIGVVIDLRPKSRFGLGDRVRAAQAERSRQNTPLPPSS